MVKLLFLRSFLTFYPRSLFCGYFVPGRISLYPIIAASSLCSQGVLMTFNTWKILDAWTVWCWVSAAFLLWHLLLSSWSLSRCLILYVVSKPFIKHCWKFCFLTSASPLSFQIETELALTTRHFRMKAPHLAFSDFSCRAWNGLC